VNLYYLNKFLYGDIKMNNMAATSGNGKFNLITNELINYVNPFKNRIIKRPEDSNAVNESLNKSVKEKLVTNPEIDESDEFDDELMGFLHNVIKKENKKNSMLELNVDIDDDFIPAYEDEPMTIDDCKICGTKNGMRISNSDGTRVCSKCGKIATVMLDESAEWRQYEGDGSSDSMVRCAGYTNHYIQGGSLGTIMVSSNFNRLKRLQQWICMDSKDRSKNNILNKIYDRCTKAGIKKCAIDDIKGMYIEFTNGTVGDRTSTVRGLNKWGLIAAITLYACKKRKIPRLPDEIAEIYDLNISDVTDGCKTFTELMQLKGIKYEMINSTPEEYLIRLAPELGMHGSFIELAVRIARNVRIIGVAAEHTPPSIAAASILLTAQLKKIKMSSDDVAAVFRISHTTGDKTMDKIKKFVKIIIDDKKSEEVAAIIAEKKKSMKPTIIVQ
jgi:transcription initiation factor TFIIIB Brf1 subunit/transcription initiation factor TFIIB